MQMWIANRWEGAADGRTFEVRNPATEDLLDTAPRAGAVDVERAVAAAQRAFPEWRRTPGIERGGKLHHVARSIREDREGLAILLTRQALLVPVSLRPARRVRRSAKQPIAPQRRRPVRVVPTAPAAQ
jgi:acyl-CoA reductase-like NAD-dependent aldehyde dehydrogenase